jgi:glucose-1-phosphate cytidylyltransferase
MDAARFSDMLIGGDMKVVILCGGLGTRLREETEFRPKPLVHIGNRPILWHIMKIYAHYGFNEFILCLGYKGEMLKEYFYNYELLNSDFTIEYGTNKHIEIHNQHAECGWKVTLADTGDRTLKGARLKIVEKYIDGDTFMVTYGDGVANIDIHALVDFHKSHGRLATVTAVNPVSRFGELNVEGNMVTRFMEKPEIGSARISGGFFVFDRGIFDYLKLDDPHDLEVGTLDKIAAMNQLMVYNHKGFWACMDTLREVEYLNLLWESREAKWKVW